MAAAVNLQRDTWPYVIESADSVTVCYVVTLDVVGDDVYRHRLRGVSIPGRRLPRRVTLV